ncbi:hypothetical protein ACIP2X_37880 [Streptomyces sp. NPDC089424]|uniref:hypothetical protein n=1 Tax=Streptomyces sp. NPDC089424 TaxID=3365917 RepID=UPI003819BEFB
MNDDVKAWLLAQLGSTTDLTDLEARYTRLKSGRAVALEVLRGRLATLLQQPSTVNVSGVVAVGFAENIKAYERQILALESGEIVAPDDPPATDDEDAAIGYLILRARPRR